MTEKSERAEASRAHVEEGSLYLESGREGWPPEMVSLVVRANVLASEDRLRVRYQLLVTPCRGVDLLA